MPSKRSCLPGRMRARFSAAESFLLMISLTSDDLPEPDTPVTHVSVPSGMLTSTLRRLFSRQPNTRRKFPFPARRCAGTAMRRLPERYWPVMLSGAFMMSCSVPCAMICPPCTPAPGPTSTI